MKSFLEILQNTTKVSVALADHQRYLAHIHSRKEAETLDEHTARVTKCALLHIEKHGLEPVVENLVRDIADKKTVFRGNEKVAEWLKKLFIDTIVFHDFGKINPAFQQMRMKSDRFKRQDFPNLVPPYSHSFPGSYIFLIAHVDRIIKDETLPEKERIGLVALVFLFSYVIKQHHSVGLECATDENFLRSFSKYSQELTEYVRLFGFPVNWPMMKGVMKSVLGIQSEFKPERIIRFPLFALLKLNYSLLTASDYLAAHQYANDSPVMDLGVFDDRERITAMIAHFRNFKHNRAIYARLESFRFSHPSGKSFENLNQLRKEMAVELIQTIRKNTNERLFYLEAPTGGGKTNMSMIAVTEILEADKTINKIFYVFPYTTLITQTYQSVKESMGLEPSEIMELHTKAPWNADSEEQKDGEYGDKKKDFIDNLFALHPVTLLSHVRFFDILKTSAKESNYLLHRLANSVVVIDELQSYNPSIWDKMLYFIDRYATYFNIRFILMSATLPKIGDLNVGLARQVPFVDLLPAAKRYVQNPNFAQRVQFSFDLFQKEIDMQQLASHVVRESENYRSSTSATGTVHTLIEFIFKKSAAGFYRTMEKIDHPFDDIFILSGTILDSRRKEIIRYIKDEHNRKRNILLITTQVVEAGVDIDMDLGYKNISLIDSDEQLAGRVNRNASKDTAKVHLFRLDDAGTLYGGDDRYKVTRQSIDRVDYQQILEQKDFSRLYNLVLKKIDGWNTSDMVRNIHSFVTDEVERLDYRLVDKKFQIISQKNISVFVPLPLPVQITKDNCDPSGEIFTASELKFLKTFGVTLQDTSVNGEEVWNIYEELIASPNDRFDLDKKVNFKILQRIMSKFTFSLIYNSKDHQNILSGLGEEKFGYVYFSHWNDKGTYGEPYSYAGGLNTESFKDICFI